MSRFTVIDTAARQVLKAAKTAAKAGPDRRAALQLLASGAALALAACQRREDIFPYVQTPEGETPGTPRRYATTLTLGGYGRGAVAVAVDGRPIKIDGGSRHPMSLGATDVFMEAAILDLYDPNRSKAARGPDGVTAWETFAEVLRARLAKEGNGGAGVALLTGRITSPSELRQIARLKQRFPAMTWARYEAVHDDNARQGARLAFGRALAMRPRLQDADVILSLGADPAGPGPEQIALARALVSRRTDMQRLSRLYVAEPSLTQTGALADHRLAADPETLRAMAMRLAGRLGAGLPGAPPPPAAARFADAAIADLIAHKGKALVLVGRDQPAELHALGHWINARLSAPVDVADPVDPHPDDHAASLATLIRKMQAGGVSTLVVLGANPAYDAPGFTAAARHAPFIAHLGDYEDETAKAAAWHAPLSHALESWGDARAVDGTASFVQPLIRPLYDTRTRVEALALLAGDLTPSARDLVRQGWPELADDAAWKSALAAGLPPAAAPHTVSAPEPRMIAPPPVAGSTLALMPHPCLWGGERAANAWLQECPDPITKEVWGSALRLCAADAQRLGVKTGDRVRLTTPNGAVETPVLIAAGQAAGVYTLPLGGGRRAAGPIGTGLGVDATALRGPALAWTVHGVTMEKIAGHRAPLETQSDYRLDGETAKLVPALSFADLARVKPHAPPASQFRELPHGDHAWAMAIDTQACIGCSACVLACQSENNIPAIGPEEIEARRDLHWLRIDRYDLGSDDDPQPGFLPVPCMQCEQAPCEPVCPVEASVHDHEGLNDQVYNRCVGTRFCQANCPYKVRRFNYRDYEAGRIYGDLDATSLKAQRNPEVTVRARGVMEKCTYCVQRIAAAKSDSERTGAPIADGALKTACQSACPTQAITFGDLNDPAARVNALRRDPRHYVLLEELGTRPRTTYLARVRNPNPALDAKREKT